MDSDTRQRRIIEFARTRGRVDVNGLADELDVATETVRRDLNALAGVSALERRAVLELLDEGMEARVVSEVPGAIGRMRFAHALIRDAAYRRLPKAARASLHREFADWLEERAGDRAAEYEEVLGYHLELAHALRIELGRGDDETARLGERAAALLTSSGRIALGRGDIPASGSLLRRALALTPEASPARGRSA